AIALVVCQPDRPKGRGQKVAPPPVKAFAEAHGLPVIQPLKMKDGAVARRLAEDRIDLGVVAAFGRILPKDVLEAGPFGFLNVHAPLPPRHGGASPIHYAILEGDAVSGVTLMQMTEGLDEGPTLLRESCPIGSDTVEALGERLADMGARLA